MPPYTDTPNPEMVPLEEKDKSNGKGLLPKLDIEAPMPKTQDLPGDKEIASLLTARVHRGKKILDLCETELLDSLKVEGMTLREWGDYLNIEVPKDSDNLEELEKTATNIGRSLQEAERILALYELKASAAANFHEEGFAKAYVDEMEGKSRVAAEKIRQIVLATNQDVDYSLATSQAAQVIVSYFKRIIKGLDSIHKGLENRIKLVQIRLKYLSYGL